MRIGLLLFFTLLLGGCATSQPQDKRPYAWLTPGVRVELPPPGIEPAFQQQQLLTGIVNGKSQSLVVLLNANADEITLDGLSSVGIRLFRVIYDAQGIHTRQMLALPQMPPASQVLADIMLSHWPLATWKTQLPAGWTLQDESDARYLRDSRGKVITEIHYLQRGNHREPISIQQHAFGYHILIQHLDAS